MVSAQYSVLQKEQNYLESTISTCQNYEVDFAVILYNHPFICKESLQTKMG